MHNKKELLSRRNAVRQAVGAAGLSAIFKMTEGPAEAQARRGGAGQVPGGAAPGGAAPAGAARGGGGGGGRGAANVLYGAINKYSSPSDLRITDMRALTVAANFDYPIIRLDTNQGVYGLGEVRDAGTKNSALMLKQFVVGANPLNISSILRTIRPYAWHGRQGGGYSAVDLALHDLVGKVFGVPVWRLLGDKYRDRVRMYCDTVSSKDPKVYAQRMQRRKASGYTFFKMDLQTQQLIGDKPGAVDSRGVATAKGLLMLCEYIAAIRDIIGWDAPLAVDHFGPLDVYDSINYARAFEPYRLAWAEDILQVNTLNRGDAPLNWRAYKQIKAATATPLGGFESLFGLEEGYKNFLDNDAISVIHPDPGTSGQCRETKRIADYAGQYGIPTAIHMAGSPLGTMGAVHTVATVENFLAMECHAADFMSWWQELVAGVPKPIIDKGYITVPDTPGLGIELNEPVVKEHLRYPGYFEPTADWDNATARPQGTTGYPHFNAEGQWVTTREE
jgi:L-alanine-DL-glutamate epimerase-like enolase superfamily enzyme